jgi:hypothetical protein
MFNPGSGSYYSAQRRSRVDPELQAITARIESLQRRMSPRADSRLSGNALRLSLQQTLEGSRFPQLSSYTYMPSHNWLSDSPRRTIPKSGQVSGRLPNELIQRVIDHLGNTDSRGALASLLQTSRAAYDAVAPVLYDNVLITRQNAKSFYRGLPPGLPRVKRAKTSKGTTWDKFERETAASRVDSGPGRVLSDCERELEATRRDIRRQQNRHRDRKHHDVWPHVDVDSDDSDLESDSDSSDIGDGVDNTTGKKRKHSYITDSSTIDRKEKLLELVKRIHFEELPPTYICENLARLQRQNMLPEMKSLITVSFRPNAVWGIIEWENRHESRDRHPFLIYTKSLPAAELCVQFPLIDRHVEKSFMLPRIVSREAHRSRDHGDQHEYLRAHLKNLVSGQDSRLLRLPSYFAGSSVKRLTVHNLPSKIPFPKYTFTSCRVFYRDCVCRDSGTLDKVQDKHCYNHYTSSNRVSPLELPKMDSNSLFSKDDLEQLVLVDLDRNTKNRLNAAMAQKTGRDKDHLDLVVSMVSSAETEPCSCCGLKQLSGEEVGSSRFAALKLF